MGVRQLLGNAVDVFGTAFNLPEGNFSERIAGGNTVFTGSNPRDRAIIQSIQSSGQSSAGVTTTQQQRGSGGGGGTTPTPSYSTPSYDITSEVQQAIEGDQARTEDAIAASRDRISSEFDPIFGELDRQIGLLPEQRQAYEKQIVDLATSQRESAERERGRNVEKLDLAKEEEKDTAKKSVRDLEEDIRNQLEARSIFFGNLGAGDSSAPLVASEAIAKEGLKARSNILGIRNKALNALEQKKADVNNLATEQFAKIDEFKSTKLFEIGQFFQDQLTKLKTAKANAQGEKARAINDVIFGLQSQFIARAQQLEDTVLNYKASVQQWQLQRTAELEDFQTRLAVSARYSSTSPSTYKLIQDDFGNVVAIDPRNPTQPVEVIGDLGTFGQEPEEEQGILGRLGVLFGIGDDKNN